MALLLVPNSAMVPFTTEVNWTLCALGVAIICGFTLNQATPTVNTTSLSNAYGVAVLSVMLCTTFLVTLVIVIVWRKHILIAIAFFCTFFFIEGIYFSSTLFKIPHGACHPLLHSIHHSFRRSCHPLLLRDCYPTCSSRPFAATHLMPGAYVS